MRILLAEDDQQLRDALARGLREQACEVDAVADGDAAVAQALGRAYDVLVLDVLMPGRDGFTVCRALKQDPRWADIPVILLSAKGQESDRVRGLALGAADFLTKPYSPADLLQRVRRHLARV